VNSRDDVVFIGDLTPMATDPVYGVFLYSHGRTLSVARPGDAMPGGGHIATAGFVDGTYGLNDSGDVGFAAALDTDDDGDGAADTGVYIWSNGWLRLVARTGTVIPGLGTVEYLGLAEYIPSPYGTGGMLNNRGQVLFFATLT